MAGPIVLELGAEVPCQYEGCDQPSTHLACGRRNHGAEPAHESPGLYCRIHAGVVAGEGDPEYVAHCPNCGCLSGVN